jgi:hypothetical protein
VPDSWSKRLLARRPCVARALSGRHSAAGFQCSSPSRYLTRFGIEPGTKVILNLKRGLADPLGRLLRPSHNPAGWEAFSRSTGMLPISVHPLRLRTSRDLVHSGSPK